VMPAWPDPEKKPLDACRVVITPRMISGKPRSSDEDDSRASGDSRECHRRPTAPYGLNRLRGTEWFLSGFVAVCDWTKEDLCPGSFDVV